jgi:hypothetical protein
MRIFLLIILLSAPVVPIHDSWIVCAGSRGVIAYPADTARSDNVAQRRGRRRRRHRRVVTRTIENTNRRSDIEAPDLTPDQRPGEPPARRATPVTPPPRLPPLRKKPPTASDRQ